MNRQSPIDELPRSPLVLVIGQVRFSPVRKMPEMVDDLQDTMRYSGLERFEEEQVQQVTFGPKVTTTDVTRWVFRNRERSESVFLTQDFVVLVTSTYEKFDDFNERLVELVNKIREVADPSFIEQIGIRYLNMLRKIDEIEPRSLVAEQLRGLSSTELDTESHQNQSMTRGQTDIGMLSIRCIDLVGPDFLPADLQVQGMHIPNSPDDREPCCLLDIDNTTLNSQGIEFDDLSDMLWKLHRHTSIGFKCSVTEEARERWRKSE